MKTFIDMMPVAEVSAEHILNMKKQLVDEMFKTAMEVFAVNNENDLLVRGILPDKDLSLAARTWKFDFSGAAVPASINILPSGYLVPRDKMFGFIGAAAYTQPVSDVSTILFKSGASEIAIYDIQKLNAYNSRAGYFSNAVIIRPQKGLEIYYYVNTAQIEYVPLFGYVAEAKGTTLNAETAI